MNKQKLELTWIGKNRQPNVEARILIEDKEKSYGDKDTQNMLIHGDNLLAIKALEQNFSNKIKCIYIDPPYNINAAGVPYEDNIEHSLWLNLMRNRLVILKRLLAEDGVICIQCDDEEQAYLKVLCDEIFGRNNFLNMIVVESGAVFGTKVAHVQKKFVKVKDYILIYSKNNNVKINPLYQPLDEIYDTHYSTMIDENGEKKSFLKYLQSNKDICELFKKYDKKLSLKNIKQVMQIDEWFYKYITEEMADKIYTTHPYTINISEELKQKIDDTHAYLIDGKYLTKTSSGTISVMDNFETCLKIKADGIKKRAAYRGDLWKGFQLAMQNVDDEGGVYLKNSKKPEKLVMDILNAFTNEDEWVLDSFLGSGTTSAVAHKMKRKWIGIELGEHAYTLCKVRLDNVINGDMTGISSEVNWKGGGGYKFYELAPSLLEKDKFNNWIISEKYDGEMLIKAICKQEKFEYEQEKECYWKQGKSSENDYIYVTTNYLSLEYLNSIKEEMKENESLLICCKSYQEECEEKYDNITIKKIPQSILNNCEFGHNDYSLNVKEVLDLEENDE